MTQTDGVKVDIFPTQWRHGVNRIGEAPRPRTDGAKPAIGQKGGNGNTDAGAHDHTVGCSIGLSEESVVKDNALRHGMMALC